MTCDPGYSGGPDPHSATFTCKADGKYTIDGAFSNCQEEATCGAECDPTSCGVAAFVTADGTFSAVCSDSSNPHYKALYSGIVLETANTVVWSVPGTSNLEGLAVVGAVLLQQGTDMEVNGPPSATCPMHRGCPSDGPCPCSRAGSTCASANVGCHEVRARFELTVNAKLTLSHIVINGQTANDRHKDYAGHEMFPVPNGGALMIMMMPNSMAVLTNCEIAGNSAFEGKDGSGGAIYVLPPASLDIADSIIAGNRAHEHGGGIYVNAGSASTIKVVDTVFCDNLNPAWLPGGRNGVFWNQYAAAVSGGVNDCVGPPFQAHCWPKKPADTCSIVQLTEPGMGRQLLASTSAR